MTATEAAVEGTRVQHEGPSTRGGRAVGVALAVASLGLVLDQGTKALAAAQLTPGDRVPLLGDLLGLSLVYNPGAAFSLGSGATWIFTIVGVLAAAVTIVFAVRLHGIRWGLALGLVLGGAVGNLLDRLVNPPAFGQGHVTDFLSYGDLFVGNVADVLVVAGVALLCLINLRSGHWPEPRRSRKPDADRDLVIARCDKTRNELPLRMLPHDPHRRNRSLPDDADSLAGVPDLHDGGWLRGSADAARRAAARPSRAARGCDCAAACR